MIVVTGATGQLGRAIVEKLLDRVPSHRVGACSRDPEKAEALIQCGVRLRRGDFADPSSLRTAFEGASQVLIVSSNARASGGDAVAHHQTAIAAAKAAGVRRIVYTSHMGASTTSAFRPMHDHAATEVLLAEAGIAWTSLRNGFYASAVSMLVGDAATSGVLSAPADGKVSWTTHADLAEAAALVLTGGCDFDGPTPPLTSGEALDLADVAELIAAMSGRSVERRLITDAEHEIKLSERGLPPSVIDIAMGLFRASRADEFSSVDPTLAKLLGRSPTPLCDVLAERVDL